MADSSSRLSSRMAKLNPFKRRAKRGSEDDEDKGDEIDSATVAGGGHSSRLADAERGSWRVSDALRALLVREGAVAEGDEGALRALLERPHLSVPARVVDRSHPLPEYFISSSHNTYLMAHQLYGASSAGAYEAALATGARCIEIDAWDDDDNPDEPKVTHGYTLVSNIAFRAVCETIREVVDREAASEATTAAPILLSLENHCGPAGQRRLVEIMKEVWGHRLLAAPVHADAPNPEDHATLEELASKVVVIVEHHIPDEADSDSDSSSSSSSSDDDDDSEKKQEKQARQDYKEASKKKAAVAAIIVPELAALGVYAQSVKPSGGSWFGAGGLRNGPHHHLINVSETGLAAHLPASAADIARHNARHLMRVYPKGTRVSSRNLEPVPFWGLGAQICALNWQTFGAGMQLNEALFAGTAGFVLKPDALRASSTSATKAPSKVLRLRVAGATDVPLPAGRAAGDVKPYLTCTLQQPGGSTKRKTAACRVEDGGSGEGTFSAAWDETLEWRFTDDELVFVRLLVKSDDSFSSNPVLAAAAVRLLYVVPGWVFVPMLDLKGHQTKCSLLVRFDVEDA